MKNKIFAFIGPSGSGKTTIIRYLTKNIPQLQEAISLATRKPRIGEVDGVDYYFVDQDTFDITAMYEKTYYAGNSYGLAKEEIDGILKDKNVIVAVDINGLQILEKEFGKDNVISFFVYAPLRLLKQRMKNRGDSEDKIQQRLDNIERTFEYGNLVYCDYICENTEPLEKQKDLIDVIQNIIKNIDIK